jgi:hypothetical protein
MSLTQRQRAANDPFWATSLNRMTPAGQRLARGLHQLIRRSPALKATLWIGSGWRSSSSEHVTGRGLDVIATERTGIRARTGDKSGYAAMNRLINEVLIPNAKVLGIRHIIWDRRIYRTRYGEWGPLPGRNANSSISDWHEDHAHLWLEPSGVGWLDRLDTIVIGDKITTTKPAPAPSKPTTPAKPKTKYKVVTKVLPLAGRSGPGKSYRQTMRAWPRAVLDIVETKGGWAKSTGGHWYSLSYLKRV